MAKTPGKAYFMISAVAERYNIHPQTLRLYEREGLLKPSRTEGNTRLYSEEDLEQLETILSLTRDLGAPLDRAGRVMVEEDLSVPGRPEVFAVGDLISKTQSDKPLPGVAQLALQSGTHAARNIALSLHDHPREAFFYLDKGSMATIGRNKAVAQIGRFRFSGMFAWWLWLFVHIMSLVDHKKKITVLFEWAWAYWTWQRRSRVILEVPRELTSPARPVDGPRLVPEAPRVAVGAPSSPH